MTRSPGLKSAEADSVTTPEYSWPSTVPVSNDVGPGSVAWRSEPQMPQYATFITMSPGRATGVCRSSIVSASPGRWNTAARTGLHRVLHVAVHAHRLAADRGAERAG